jgi:hypothetical protein
MKKTILLILPMLALASCDRLNKEFTRKEIALALKYANARLSNEIFDEGILYDSIGFCNDEITYHFSIDEEHIDIETMKEFREEIRDQHKSDLLIMEKEGIQIFSMLNEIDGKITYIYTGNISGDTIKFTFTY